ncbi:unnamed protein product [Bursaphelenchus okinawaensis]|uniref:Uncharacterized protein n=1 Tax=Bursaphelenchus okinawaensis TaxID=465554 RepID=A0A811K655_9BILA|nr:unnamed protein product [Bursaphelenchus okinawaensis]CAG9092894.1 unnamed protein product [Bursaphelenchus okinawaensis]
MSDEFAEEASIMMENAELNFAAEHNGHYERGPMTPPEVTEPSTSVLNGPPTEEEGTETFIETESAVVVTEKSVLESDGEISSNSDKESVKLSPKPKKRKHSQTNGEYTGKTENGNKFKPSDNLPIKSRYEPVIETENRLSHPLVNAVSHVKNMPYPMAFDFLLTIPLADVAHLNLEEALEVLDAMKQFNDRRLQTSENRVQLTNEVRQICDQEIQLLTDLEHLMTQEERLKLEQLRNCPMSMDEVLPLKVELEPSDVNVQTGSIKLSAVDLLPPPDTPFIGKVDPIWEPLAKHIPMELRGFMPPTEQRNKKPEIIHPLPGNSEPVPNVVQPSHEHVLSSKQQQAVKYDKPPPNLEVPPPNLSQPPPSMPTAVPPAVDTSVPPPSLYRPPPEVPSSIPSTNSGAISPMSALRQSIKPSLLNTLVNTSLPPPNLNVPPPNLSLPPPNLNLPPPNVQVPPPSHNIIHSLNVPLPVVDIPKVASLTSQPPPVAAGGSPINFTVPPPTVKPQGGKIVPLMSIAHPPGFVPRIHPGQQGRKQKKNKPSSSSTPTQGISSPSVAESQKPEKVDSDPVAPAVAASGVSLPDTNKESETENSEVVIKGPETAVTDIAVVNGDQANAEAGEL